MGKDDDTNHHIDFITAVANLRARKIIPAIATSTALIVGVCGMELLKSVSGTDITLKRNSFVNLALPLYLFSEPYPPKYKTDSDYDEIMMGPVKAIPGKFSCWDKEHVKGPMTIGGIIQQS